MDYTIWKWLHVLSSTLLFGTGIGSAFYLLAASLRGEPKVVAYVAATVVRADWLFTATTVVLQPFTGWMLMRLAHIPHDVAWIRWSIVLYVIAILCWLPVVWLQMRMRDLAAQAAAAGTALPARYRHHFAVWVTLGVPAFLAFLAIFYLMVAKPTG